jgi:serine/threonine protein kinase
MRMNIPDHNLLSVIGKGSYGEVWLARNVMGTYRAVKIVSRASFEDAVPFERELAGIRAFEPVSRTHEGLVDVLHIGHLDADTFYYIMEVADDVESGQNINPDRYLPLTLSQKLLESPKLSVKNCVEIALALSRALSRLHEQGLIHRDVKPSNIIFVHGAAKLADIGLVAEVDDAHSFVGTAGFIAPEGPGTKQADIYSLGKVLYEMSSGRDRQEFPNLPSRIGELSDGEGFLELNEVVLRACQVDPRERYQTAEAMADDLALLASGRSVRRLRTLERRWSRFRRIAPVAVGFGFMAALLGFLLVRD